MAALHPPSSMYTRSMHTPLWQCQCIAHSLPPPICDEFQFTHIPCNISQRLMVDIVGIVAKTEGMINSWLTSSIDAVDCWRERFQRGEVHKRVFDGNGSLVRDLMLIESRQIDHVFSIQIKIRRDKEFLD